MHSRSNDSPAKSSSRTSKRQRPSPTPASRQWRGRLHGNNILEEGDNGRTSQGCEAVNGLQLRATTTAHSYVHHAIHDNTLHAHQYVPGAQHNPYTIPYTTPQSGLRHDKQLDAITLVPLVPRHGEPPGYGSPFVVNRFHRLQSARRRATEIFSGRPTICARTLGMMQYVDLERQD